MSTLATMPRADKFRVPVSSSISVLQRRTSVACVSLVISSVFGFAGCDQLTASRSSQLVQDADAKSVRGDFDRAINLYEAALDDSPRCAEIHYKLALLYDDKLNDPVSALHHFRRYLALSPTGPHANDVKKSIKRDEVAVLTTLSGDSVITQSEAAGLRNENFQLRKELAARTGLLRNAADKSQTRDSGSKKIASGKGTQTYVVQSGDTLASISRKFYKSSTRWKDIFDANRQHIRNPKDLTVGQTLVIPE